MLLGHEFIYRKDHVMTTFIQNLPHLIAASIISGLLTALCVTGHIDAATTVLGIGSAWGVSIGLGASSLGPASAAVPAPPVSAKAAPAAPPAVPVPPAA